MKDINIAFVTHVCRDFITVCDGQVSWRVKL